VRHKVTIGFEGELGLPPREAEALGLAPGDPVDLVTARGAFALLAPARGQGKALAHFGGSLAALTVPEVVQFVFTSLKSGVLLLAFGTEEARATGAGDQPERLRRKSIHFKEGQVVFASSSDPADRLGAVLWRHELVGRAELERCGRLVRSGRPLGQVLVDEGILTPGQLYSGVTLQVKEILLNAFLEAEGEFAFLEGPHDEQNTVRLPERTRDLLLQGMKRLDAAEGALAAAGGRGAVLRAAMTTLPGLGPQAARLLAALDGQRTLEAAAQESGLGLHEALVQLGPLLQAGAVVAPAAAPRAAPAAAPVRVPAGSEEEEVFSVEATIEPAAELPVVTPPPGTLRAAGGPRPGGPFETYRRIFRRVAEALATVEPEARARLDSYFERLPEKRRFLFEGVRFGEGGELDVARVLANVTAAGTWKGAAARARSLEALEDLLNFSLFEVKNRLPPEAAERVLREVGRMQVGKA
jgi:hypothetical protein